MRIATLTIGAFLLLATIGGIANAQETPPGQKEKQPPPPQPQPEAQKPLELIPADPHCPPQPCTVLKILDVEKQICLPVIEPREVIRQIKRPTLVIDYREEKKIVTDMVMQPKEVLREVPCTTMQPCTVTDPCTGECKTIYKPVTEIKIQKDVVYTAVPTPREVVVRIPYLKEVEEIVEQRDWLLEWVTSVETRTFVTAVPDQPEPRTRHFITPRPPCPPTHDGHHPHH